MLSRVGELCRPSSGRAVHVVGDFNFQVDGVGRTKTDTLISSRGDLGLSKFFNSAIHHLTELSQEDFTHRVVRNGAVSSLGRNDRVYTNLHPLDIVDADVHGGTTHNIEDLGFPSDHVLVWVTFGPPPDRQPAHSVIPRWIAKHVEFGGLTM